MMRRRAKKSQVEMSRIEMADGLTVVFPAKWCVLNPDEALTCSHAGFMVVPPAIKDDMPVNYLFFAEKPCADFDDDDFEVLFRMVELVWPQFDQIRTYEDFEISEQIGSEEVDEKQLYKLVIETQAARYGKLGALASSIISDYPVEDEHVRTFDKQLKDVATLNPRMKRIVALGKPIEEVSYFAVDIPQKGAKPGLLTALLMQRAYVESSR